MATKAPGARALSNDEARRLFLATALPRSNMVSPNQAFAPGAVIATQIPGAGVARFLRVAVNIPLTLTLNGGTITASPKAPWSLFPNVRLQDYAGIERVNCSAYMLYLLQIMRRRMFEPSNPYPFATGSPPAYWSSLKWNVPTAAGNGVLTFDFVIPLAFGYDDPRGALMQAIPNGRTQLFLTCVPTLYTLGAPATTDALYTTTGAATVTLNGALTPTITVGYYFWDPVAYPGLNPQQFPGSVPLPFNDLALIHELRSQTDTSNMAAGLAKVWSLQSGRDYYRFISSVNENGTLSTNHVARSRVVYDGNTPSLDEYTQLYESRMQEELGRALPDGMIGYDWVNRPWDANSYGELGVETTYSSAFTNTGNTYMEYMAETMYVSSTPNA